MYYDRSALITRSLTAPQRWVPDVGVQAINPAGQRQTDMHENFQANPKDGPDLSNFLHRPVICSRMRLYHSEGGGAVGEHDALCWMGKEIGKVFG